MNKQAVGKKGEEFAMATARADGYQVIEHNYRCPLGEIDLILQKGDIVVFAEVKTRRGDSFGEAWESVTEAKQERIRKVAAWYVRERDLCQCTFRFDVFSIQIERQPCQYRWFKDAF
ncbi:MAG: YraN family protein [Eubacteriales bacterium]|nr:YraN family protein [Eubacteriales bacterium]MDD3073728.1 YraN family protein [Eubacteriales bacterium]MDD4078581.1 YraN family protein [Eubacteriales bacterium]MDD4768545.1 YraN family protein [Eubacteriales bacterium]